NVAVSYWGGERRAATFEQLSLAIQRQSLLTEVHNTLEEQRRIVALTAAGGGTPLRTERAQFAAELAAVPERFAALVALSDGQEREAAYAMETAARALADRWTTFYVGSANDAGAHDALQAADPLADRIIHVAIPAAMDVERRHVAELTASFRRTEETVSIVAWSIFLLSAGLGGLLLYLVLRSLPVSARALER